MAGAMSRQQVQQHYAEVATRGKAYDYNQELYDGQTLESLPTSARCASRGCGNPLDRAGLKPGERVLDLGSGGGIDVLLAARQVGNEGFVYGLDMTPEMVELARRNAAEAEVRNVEFVLGLIESIPLPDGCVDVVTSNCVINLCENRSAVLREACRVLRRPGRACIADIVCTREDLPSEWIQTIAPALGCLNGVLTTKGYYDRMQEAGFSDIAVEPYYHSSHERLVEKATARGMQKTLELLGNTDFSETFASAYITASRR
jgi:ubiquinone/menaquinone biosynthesis C-methylase UbiE